MDFDPEKYKIEESNAALGLLPGAMLEALILYSDCIKLIFSRSEITVRTEIYFRKDGKTIFKKSLEWLDCLAGCVWHHVTKAEQVSDTDLVVTFDDGSAFMLSLRQKDRTGEPAIHMMFERSW